MKKREIVDDWLGFDEFFNQDDKTWTPRKIKELLQDIISSGLLDYAKPNLLISYLDVNKAANLENNRHKDFMKNLLPASKTTSGLKKILDYANSDDSVQMPPNLSGHYEEETDEETEVKQVTSDDLYHTTDSQKNPLENKRLETTTEILNQTIALESLSISDDSEKMKFFVNYFINLLWRKAFVNEKKEIPNIKKDYNKIKNNPERKFGHEIFSRFLSEYEGAKSLVIPPNKFPYEPFLMQRYIAYKIKLAKRFANFSGTGSGKTFSGVLASRLSNCKMTIVICPKHVVPHWEEKIIIPDEGPIFENTEVVSGKKAFLEQRNEKKHKFLVLNWDKFNQATSVDDINELEDQKIDMIILDEIHFVKDNEPKKDHVTRRENLEHLISNIKRKNKKFMLLGLSATPIINHLKEGKSLLELVTGEKFDGLNVRPYVMNAVRMYEYFTNISIRHLVDYDNGKLRYWDVEAPLPDKKIFPYLMNSPLGVEVLLTEARIPMILEKIDGPTIIYTEYVGGRIPGHQEIETMLGDAVKKEIGEDNVGFYTGRRADGLQLFLDGEIQVLIASRPIAVGVDKLQYRCKNLIFNSLPWTNAAYRQIIGRILRTGMDESKTVNIHHIRARFPGVLYDKITKLKRIDYKKSLADCAVDGELPEGVLVTPEQATKEAVLWLERLSRNEIAIINRIEWDRQLEPSEERKLLRKLGDFSKMNQQYAIANSSTMHSKLIKDTSWFVRYHELQERTDASLKANPRDYWIRVLKKSGERKKIADFGCGKAQIQEAIGSKVISFEHVAIDDFNKVKCCDIGNEKDLRRYLKDGEIDIALFCRSLSCGKNWKDYLKNAHWALVKDGQLYIAETTSHIDNKLKNLRDIIKKIGFTIYRDEIIGEHTFIRAIKK